MNSRKRIFGPRSILVILLISNDNDRIHQYSHAFSVDKASNNLNRFCKYEERASSSSIFLSRTTRLWSSSIVLPPSINSPKDRKNNRNSNNKGENKNNNNYEESIEIEKAPQSNFWYAIPKQPEDAFLPNVAYLDSDGILPPNAYQTLSAIEADSSTFVKKATCLMTIAIRLDEPNPNSFYTKKAASSPKLSIDADSIVQGMHNLIDSGLTSFQIGPTTDDTGNTMQAFGESEIYARLKHCTPSSVLENCHLSTFVNPPPAPSWMMLKQQQRQRATKINNSAHNTLDDGMDGYGNGHFIKTAISGSLLRMGTDCLDSVQLVYQPDSPYHMDTLNTLLDMQQEGKIRSITGLNFPPKMLQMAHENGFTLDSNQLTANILNQQSISTNSITTQTHMDMNTKMLLSNPLLGGILSDYFFWNHRREPYLLDSHLSWSKRQNINMIRIWGKSIPNPYKQAIPAWDLFHKYILTTLYDISNQYQVSMASVALRYMMQKTTSTSKESSLLGSMIVGSRVGLSEEWHEKRPHQFREVFGFALEKGDMDRLDEVAALGRLTSL